MRSRAQREASAIVESGASAQREAERDAVQARRGASPTWFEPNVVRAQRGAGATVEERRFSAALAITVFGASAPTDEPVVHEIASAT
jgi:hypothetical protein